MLAIVGPQVDNLQDFLVAGGNVLVIIMVVTFVMWLFLIERLLYFSLANGGVKKRAVRGWSDRGERNSQFSLWIRERRISEVRQSANRNMTVIKVLIAILPLLGLLGTVTGMVEVFDVMASTGSSNARLMAGGITKATIPTMAGLFSSLTGIIMINIINWMSSGTVTEVSDRLVVEA